MAQSLWVAAFRSPAEGVLRLVQFASQREQTAELKGSAGVAAFVSLAERTLPVGAGRRALVGHNNRLP